MVLDKNQCTSFYLVDVFMWFIFFFLLLPFQTQWQDTPTMCTTWTNWLYMWHPSQLRTMKVYRYMINKKLLNTVFPHIVSAETIFFEFGHYSVEETIQRRKLYEEIWYACCWWMHDFGNSKANVHYQIILENYTGFMFSLSQELHISQYIFYITF